MIGCGHGHQWWLTDREAGHKLSQHFAATPFPTLNVCLPPSGGGVGTCTFLTPKASKALQWGSQQFLLFYAFPVFSSHFDNLFSAHRRDRRVAFTHIRTLSPGSLWSIVTHFSESSHILGSGSIGHKRCQRISGRQVTNGEPRKDIRRQHDPREVAAEGAANADWGSPVRFGFRHLSDSAVGCWDGQHPRVLHILFAVYYLTSWCLYTSLLFF